MTPKLCWSSLSLSDCCPPIPVIWRKRSKDREGNAELTTREHWGVVSTSEDLLLRPTQGSWPTGCSHGPFIQSQFTHTLYLYDSLRSCPCRRCTKSLLLRQAVATNFTDGRVSNSGFNHCLRQLWYPAIPGASGGLEIRNQGSTQIRTRTSWPMALAA